VKRVSMHEPLTNLRKVVVLIMDRKAPRTEIWRALYGAAAWNRAAGKYVVAVNEDIDPDNADALLWAMSYRANRRSTFRSSIVATRGTARGANGTTAKTLRC